MKILYTHSQCPDCPPVIKKLKLEGVVFEERDISESILYLKEFLKLRDSAKEFDSIKEEGYIGVPVLIDGERVEIF